jgi:hypothetical protein
MNTLYYGDNLQILREHIKDESVDLIYLETRRSIQARITMFCFARRPASNRMPRSKPSRTLGTGRMRPN